MTLPYLFLDIDGVLQAPFMKYGYERTSVVRERIPRDLVHPLMIPHDAHHRKPDYLKRRRPPKPTVTFQTPVRTSVSMREALAAMPVQHVMLTTWLEHDSVDAFFAQTPGPELPGRRNLRFPGRDADGALPWDWKYDLLREVLAADPRPYIWADDDEVPKFEARIEHEFSHLPHLLISPNSNIGLTPSHIAQMRAFAEEHSA